MVVLLNRHLCQKADPSSLVPPGVSAVRGTRPSASRAPNTLTMLSLSVAPPVLDRTVLRAPLPTYAANKLVSATQILDRNNIAAKVGTARAG